MPTDTLPPERNWLAAEPEAGLEGWWSVSQVIGGLESRGPRRVFVVYLLALAASIVSGIATVRLDLSGLPIALGDYTVNITIYPPLLIGMLIFLWLGPTWAIVSTFVAAFALGIDSGMPWVSTALFALADPVLILLVWGGLTVLEVPPVPRRVAHWMSYLVLCLAGSVASSVGAMVWNYDHGLGFSESLDIWEGWVLGAFLQGGILVLLLHWLWGKQVRALVDRALEMDPKRLLRPSTGSFLLCGAVVLFAAVAVAVGRQFLSAISETGTTPDELLQRLREVGRFGVLTLASLAGIGILFTVALTRRNERERRKALFDRLTGAMNRRAFDSIYPIELQRSVRLSQPAALAFLDIDHFKKINDQHGHLVGDQALRQVATLLRGSIRGTDYLFRWGGEEFALLLPHTDLDAAAQLAERVRAKLAETPLVVPGVTSPVHLNASVGVAGTAEDGRDGEALLGLASAACRRAKEKGRDRVEVMGAQRLGNDKPPPAPETLADAN